MTVWSFTRNGCLMSTRANVESKADSVRRPDDRGIQQSGTMWFGVRTGDVGYVLISERTVYADKRVRSAYGEMRRDTSYTHRASGSGRAELT